MKKVIILLLTAVFLLSGCGQKQEDIVPAYSELAETEDEKIDETITLFALGDNLLHMPVVNSGKLPDGTYEYSHLFENLQPEIKKADLAVIGQETIFGGEQLGYSGYPLFNSPSDMGKSLVNEGFDVILHASNHTLDKGAAAIENTINFWKSYPDIYVLGINETPEEKNTVEIANIKGADIALLNYTYGTNGINLPLGKEHLINYIDTEKIMQDSLYAGENADFTVAFMHWGTEYSVKPDESQKTLARRMCEWGVDLIIGSHPHVIEPVEKITSENGNTTVVYYSLGNFVSRQLEARNLLGGAAKVSLKYDGEKVILDDYSFMPIVTHYDTTYTKFSVYPLKNYSDVLASGHGITSHDGAVSVERWTKMVETIFDGWDTSIIDL